MKKLITKKPLIIISSVVIVIILVVGVVVWWQLSRINSNSEPKPQPEKTVSVCDDQIVNNYNSIYYQIEGRKEASQKLIDKIKTKDNFQDDPTCLYLLSINYADIKDYAKAFYYLKDLEDVIKTNSQVKVSDKIVNKSSVEELKSYYGFMFVNE